MVMAKSPASPCLTCPAFIGTVGAGLLAGVRVLDLTWAAPVAALAIRIADTIRGTLEGRAARRQEHDMKRAVSRSRIWVLAGAAVFLLASATDVIQARAQDDLLIP